MISSHKLKERFLFLIPFVMLVIIMLGVNIFAYETQDNTFGQHYSSNLRDYTGYTSEGGVALYNLADNASGILEDKWGSSDGTRNNGQTGVVFDGTDDYIDLGNNYDLYNDKPYYLFLDLKQDTVSATDENIIVKDNSYIFRIYNGAFIEYCYNGSYQGLQITDILDTNVQHKYLIYWNGSNYKVYQDGTDVTFGSGASSCVTDKNNNINNLGSGTFDGDIYNITIGHTELSDNEIQGFFNKNKPETRSSYYISDDENNSGNFTLDKNGVINKAISFNENKYIKTNLNINSEEITYSFWINKTDENNYYDIIGNGGYGTYNTSYCIWSNVTFGNKIECVNSLDIVSYPLELYNQYNHIVYIINSTNQSLYINGILVNTTSSSGIGVNQNNFIISAYNPLSPLSRGVGSIDEVRIYDRALSAEEVHNIYEEYDKTNISVTSNLASFGVQDSNFAVAINYSGIGGSVQCGVYDNSTNLSCPIQNGVAGSSSVICSMPTQLIFETVNLKPYCTNSSLEYWGQDYDIDLLNARLNVFATAGIGGSPLSDIYVMVDNTTYQNTGLNTYAYGTGTRQVKIWASGYAYEYRNVTFTTDLQNLSVTLYEDTLIKVSTFDISGNILNDTNITFTKTGYSLTENTGADNIFYDTFDSGNYTITVSHSLYSDSDYYVTLNSGSYIILDTYLDLESDTYSRTFTVKQRDNNNNVQNALLSFYRTINGSQTLQQQKYSDYNGQALAFLDATQPYVLRVSHPSYLTKEISFTPTDSEYTVYIGEGYVPEYETIYDDISYSILPTYNILYQGQYYDFNFSISSSLGQLEYWGLSVNNNGVITTQNITGQPSGSETNLNIYIGANTTAYIPVTVRYFFKSGAEDEEWSVTRTYWAYPNQISNNTIASAFALMTENLSPNGEKNYVQYLLMGFITIALVGFILISTGLRNLELIGTITVSIFSFWCLVGWFDWWLWALIAIPIYLLTIIKMARGS